MPLKWGKKESTSFLQMYETAIRRREEFLEYFHCECCRVRLSSHEINGDLTSLRIFGLSDRIIELENQMSCRFFYTLKSPSWTTSFQPLFRVALIISSRHWSSYERLQEYNNTLSNQPLIRRLHTYLIENRSYSTRYQPSCLKSQNTRMR